MIPFIIGILQLITSDTHAISYTYDGMHRLARITYDNGDTIGYLYDQAGNITRIQRAGSAEDEMLDIDGNGTVEITDALWVLKILTGENFPAGEERADWNTSQLAAANGLGVAIAILNKVAESAPVQ